MTATALTAKDTGIYRQLIRIAAPIAMQSLLSAMVNMVSTMMVGRLGDAAVTAVGQSNRIMLVVNVLFFGITAGSAIFISQYWGARDLLNIRRVTGISITATALSGLIVVIALFLIPRTLVGVYIKDAAVLGQGVEYIQIIAFSIVFSAISFSVGGAMKSIGQARLPMVTSFVALTVNILLSYMLIFGRLGLPALGIRGAAIATVIARMVECVLIVSIGYAVKSPVLGRLREHFSYNASYFFTYLKTARWVILNELFWVIGFSLYSAIYGRMGIAQAAAMQVATTLFDMAFVFGIGIANAASVLIGERLGAGDEAAAYDHGRKILWLTVAVSAVVAVGFVAGTEPFVRLFHLSEEASGYAREVLVIMGIFMIPRIFNMVMIVGVLRSGGKAVFTMLLDVVGVWGIGLPFGWVAAFVLHLPLQLVFATVCMEEAFKMVAGLLRFRRRKWIDRVIQDMPRLDSAV